MRFTVVVPVRNSGLTLRETLDSISTQTFTDFEVIVVDDGSTDDSVAVAETHPLHCRVIRLGATTGPGAARNVGISAGRGEYLTFLDSDDLWFPWTLAIVDLAIQIHDNPAWVSGKEIRGEQTPLDSSDLTGDLRTTAYPNFLATSHLPLWIGVGGIAISRTALHATGGFAEWDGNCEDTHLWLHLGVAPGFLRIESPPLFIYRQSAGSLTRKPQRIAAGYRSLVVQEKAGNYPCGDSSKRLRRQVILRHARSGSISLLHHGLRREAIALYLETFFWNLRSLRAKYLLGFWLLVLRNRDK